MFCASFGQSSQLGPSDQPQNSSSLIALGSCIGTCMGVEGSCVSGGKAEAKADVAAAERAREPDIELMGRQTLGTAKEVTISTGRQLSSKGVELKGAGTSCAQGSLAASAMSSCSPLVAASEKYETAEAADGSCAVRAGCLGHESL